MMAGEDIISSLPDHVLHEIISRIKIIDQETEEERFMSTKEVIKTTTTISKRWQHLWTRLPSLVFLEDDARGCYHYYDRHTNYFSGINKTLTQCRTDVNLKEFKLQVINIQLPTSQLNSWIHYAITRNVQEIDLRMIGGLRDSHSCDDELFFNNSCLISLEVSRCVISPPTGGIRWDKLKFLRIHDVVKLDENLIGKILSGSPGLETLDLNYCYLSGRIPKSLFGKFGVLERFSSKLETYKRFRNDDELFLDDTYYVGMKLSRCVFNPPPNGVIRCDKLKFLCIDYGKLDEDSIGNILCGSPFLETLQLNECYGCRRIDVTSKSVKNLVIFRYSYQDPKADYYIDTLIINAPYILTLTIKGQMYIEKILLEDMSSLVKADLNFSVSFQFAKKLGLDKWDIQREMLRGVLSSLGHVNEIAFGKLLV